MKKMYKISILGSGFVGRTIGEGFNKLGYDVIFYDINRDVVESILKSNLKATVDLKKVIEDTDISFICVPTPTINGEMDLSFVVSLTKNLALELKKKSNYHVVVVKSTVLPTTTEKILIPVLEHHSLKKVGKDIGVCVNPEFLTEIPTSWTKDPTYIKGFFNQERIVIGEFDKRAGDTVEALYKPLNVPIIRTDLKTAEMIKYASNCALASRISYWNEIFYICNKLGIDSNLVAQVAAMDHRIGKYGTVHGKAFGGKCLPKDLEAFIKFAEKIGHEPILLKAVAKVNEMIKAERGVRE